MEVQLEEAEWIQARHDQLNLIDEKRLASVCHGQLYQRRMKKAFDKKVRPREFQEGELVMKKIISVQKDNRGKRMPNYEGPGKKDTTRRGINSHKDGWGRVTIAS